MIFMTDSFKKANHITLLIKVIVYVAVGYEFFKPKSFLSWFSLILICCFIEFVFFVLPSFISFLIPRKDFMGQIAEIQKKIDDEVKEYSR